MPDPPDHHGRMRRRVMLSDGRRTHCATRAALALLVSLLAGCAPAGPNLPVTIAVRDAATRQPVPGAAVYVRSLHFHVPEPPYWQLGPGEQLSATMLTDERGEATIPAYYALPMQVMVIAPGAMPMIHVLEDHPRRFYERHPERSPHDAAWIGDRRSWHLDPALASLEIQFRP